MTEKKKTYPLRMKHDEYSRIETAAKAVDQSVNSFIMDTLVTRLAEIDSKATPVDLIRSGRSHYGDSVLRSSNIASTESYSAPVILNFTSQDDYSHVIDLLSGLEDQDEQERPTS